METSSWPGGPTVSQRNVSSRSGSETSCRTSIPTFSVQYFSATSWSCTHKWALAILIMGTTLRSAAAARLLPVCCPDPAVGTRASIALEDAARHARVDGGGGHAGPIGRGRFAIDPGEAGGERPDAL